MFSHELPCVKLGNTKFPLFIFAPLKALNNVVTESGIALNPFKFAIVAPYKNLVKLLKKELKINFLNLLHL